MTERTERMSANEAVADLGNEIMLLVEMIVEHAAPWLDGIIAAGHGGGWFAAGSDDAGSSGAPDGGDAQSSSCGWCPLCAVVAMARGDRPEFSARAIEQLAQLVGVLRAVLADRWYPGEGIHMPGAPKADREDPAQPWAGQQQAWQPAGRPAGASRAQPITVRKATSAGPGEAF